MLVEAVLFRQADPVTLALIEPDQRDAYVRALMDAIRTVTTEEEEEDG